MPKRYDDTPWWKTTSFWASMMTVCLVITVITGIIGGDAALTAQAGLNRTKPPQVIMPWPTDPSTPPRPDGSVRSWLPEPIQMSLMDIATSKITGNPLDREALVEAKEALLATGWFSEIRSISRRPGNQVVIDATFRAPVAAVRTLDGLRTVAASGELLDIRYDRPPPGMPLILNPRLPAPDTLGAPWAGDDVQAGLKLLAYIYHQNPGVYSQIRGVDVGQHHRIGRLVLLTDIGAQIIWGAAPTAFAPSEPPPEQKIAWLDMLRKSPNFGKRIDANRPVIDITSPRGIMSDQVIVTAPPPTDEPPAPVEGEPQGAFTPDLPPVMPLRDLPGGALTSGR